ncbi:MAG: SusC/RagA family TonB-linked outer membrane protein [Prevotellaceae bacterium]|nr:SusC/RagA family TonB-linked outer membrane protein [Prevotellaceae bacterium]
MKRRLTMIVTCLFLFLGTALAQSTISGTVVGDDGEPVIGATIQLKGEKVAVAVTDFDGNFSFETEKQSPMLVISYIGMKPVTVKGGQGIKVKLESDATDIGDVVVTGMQKMDKRLFTGATSKVSGEKAKLDGVADVSRALEGRVAGVSVQNVSGTFGTAPKIRVRGATSIYGSSKPLWVVDGVIMEDVTEVSADALSSGDAETLISSAIAGLNSDDIESFQILKDGSATSIYGARAMAGVIVITTKKGKAGSSRINYTGEFTMRLKPTYNQFNIMNSQEQMSVYKEMMNAGYLTFGGAYRASDSGIFGKMYHLMNTYDPVTNTFGLENSPEAINAYLRQAEYRNTNWFDELFSNAISQNHSISLSSGTDKAQYYTSFSFMTDPGWTKSSKVNRLTANVNANYNLSSKISLNFIANAAYRKQKAPGSSSQGVNAVTGEVSRDFDINPYSYAINTSRVLDPNEMYVRNNAPFNIKHELDNNYIDLDVVDLKFQAELKYKPIRKVELSAIGAYKFSTTTQAHNVRDNSNLAMAFRAMDDATMRDSNPWLYTDPDKINSLPISVLPKGGFYRETKYKMNSWDFRASASYNDVYNEDHIVNFFGGLEVNSTDRSRSYFNGVGMLFDMGYLPSFDYRYFKQASEENQQYYSLGNGYSREAAFFATATYSYQGRYTINGTVRYEGSNRLGKSRSARWLPTWNVSAAWNAHEEKFFAKLRPTMSHLTLKTSYSLTGDKPAVTNSEVIIAAFNPWRPTTNDKEAGLAISDFKNEDLTYEKKHEFNIGVDMGFLNNRINVTFDWYKRNNYDLIGPKHTMGIGGVVTKYGNVADMKSHGEEFSISTKNIVTKDFSWTTDFIYSHTKSEVTNLDSRTQIIQLITGSGFTMKGYPYRALFSIDYRGLNNQGIPTFINDKGVLTTSDHYFQSTDISHLVYEGPTDPTYTGSLGNVFKYKNWTLNVFATYSFGNKIRLDPAFYAGYSDLYAMPKEFKNRWTMAGDEAYTDVPVILDARLRQQDNKIGWAFNAFNRSTARTAKGDFIRMKEISLSYDFPKSWLTPLRINSLNMKLQGTNLFLIYSDKKLNGQDPEFFNAGGVAVPMARQFTFTLRVGL